MEKPDVVLVVDDDAAILRSIKRLVNAHGFDAQVFNSAEALQSHGGALDGVCLLLDIDLAGTSGIELRRHLARCGVSLPVIFMTGNDSQTIYNAAVASGCIGYLLKPFTGTSLMKAIERARTHSVGDLNL